MLGPDRPARAAAQEGKGMNARIVQFQLRAEDADRLSSFYRELFGWVVRPTTLLHPASGVSGSLRWIDPGEAAPPSGSIVSADTHRGIALVIEVEDLDDTLEAAERMGGKRLGPTDRLVLSGAAGADVEFELAELQDPEGNVLGLVRL
jgi:predicted enzyme related to lactoylglutathione lyase